ncbi:hypothetical protein WN944_019224 [Citrus x changshan-huyou]|uniref:Uncharacterized protein n=1 Tax=Citrus x changshan-huyou TaxID=2935761 RepID=A0AAP0LY75_9ROSI
MNLFLVDQVKEVLSRAQHIHDPEVLTKLLAKRSIDIDTEMMARAEKSNTHCHLLGFTGLVAEMELEKHYFEVMDLVEKLFIDIFDTVNKEHKELLYIVDQQYPFQPLKVGI